MAVFLNKFNPFKLLFSSLFKQETPTELFDKTTAYNYSDSNLTTEQKIELEKRRRYQAYMTLDYFLSLVTYFDFFSEDSFLIAQKAKELGQVFEKSVVTSDLLLVPFFQLNTEMSEILKNYGIEEKKVGKLISISQSNSNEKSNSSQKDNSSEKSPGGIKRVIRNIFLSSKIPFVAKKLVVLNPTKYSYEIHQLFEKAAENALLRFKTPVISSEILLITMLEAKKSKVGKLLKKCLKTESNWYTFRYALLKRLHTQELAIRTDIPKNYQYFAYLLKTQLSEAEFKTVLEKESLLPSVLLFRNFLIEDILQWDFYEALQADIKLSIKSKSTRKYSK